MAGYTRQSAANIVDGLTIFAVDLNAEYNQLQSAFNATTGHTHDGTTGNAPLINLATSVTGTLPFTSTSGTLAVARGGTGATTIAAAKTAFALDQVDNTSDANKPLSTIAATNFTALDIHSKTAAVTLSNNDEIGLLDSTASFSLKRLTLSVLSTILTSTVITTLLNQVNQWLKPQRYSVVALTSANASSFAIGTGANRSLTLTANTTLSNPSDIASYVGQQFSISGQQDTTGGFTLGFGSFWFPIGEATIPSVPLAANNKFRIDGEVVNSTRIDFKLSVVGVDAI